MVCLDADSAMIARGAQLNPSAFRKEGLLSFHETVHAYMKKVRLESYFKIFCCLFFFIVY